MTAGQAPQSINWNNLVDAINNNECVLVLGPNIATNERDGQSISLRNLLKEYLSDELLKINSNTPLLEQSDLPYIAKDLEDALLAYCSFQRKKESYGIFD